MLFIYLYFKPIIIIYAILLYIIHPMQFPIKIILVYIRRLQYQNSFCFLLEEKKKSIKNMRRRRRRRRRITKIMMNEKKKKKEENNNFCI